MYYVFLWKEQFVMLRCQKAPFSHPWSSRLSLQSQSWWSCSLTASFLSSINWQSDVRSGHLSDATLVEVKLAVPRIPWHQALRLCPHRTAEGVFQPAGVKDKGWNTTDYQRMNYSYQKKIKKKFKRKYLGYGQWYLPYPSCQELGFKRVRAAKTFNQITVFEGNRAPEFGFQVLQFVFWKTNPVLTALASIARKLWPKCPSQSCHLLKIFVSNYSSY